MSRAINLDATQDEVRAAAAKHQASISAIEPLHPKGTRVVFQNADQTAVIARAFKSKIIKGPVVRTPLRPARIG